MLTDEWDVFISHASEDKDAVARPLASLLRQSGVRVWLDETELMLGDSLRQKIDEGLSKCRFGIVVLSPVFFAKRWPQRELDGLFAREGSGDKHILHVWHHVDEQYIAARSPLLAGRLGVTTTLGLGPVWRAVCDALKEQRVRLRSERMNDLSVSDAIALIKERDYFEAEWNPNGKGLACEFRDIRTEDREWLVLDSLTGLTWQRDGRECLRHDQAEALLQDMNAARFGGFEDWRMPTLDEALAIVQPLRQGKLTVEQVFDIPDIGMSSATLLDPQRHVDPVFGRSIVTMWTGDGFAKHNGSWIVGLNKGVCAPLGHGQIEMAGLRAVR